MKKYVLFLFLIASTICFANDFKKIDTFSLVVKEKRLINNSKKEKKYSLKAKLPDTIIQEMILPKINNGEKHLYKNNEKTIYIPMFNQKIIEEYNSEEFYIIKLIKDLQNIDIKNCVGDTCNIDNKIVKINRETLDIEEIIYDESERIIFSNYEITKNGISFPFLIQVYDMKNMVSELIIEEAFINIDIDENDFSI